VLDEIIARLSGKSYADFLLEEVFLPLGMHHACVNVAPGLEAFEARRYGADGVAYPPYVTDHPGASEVYCSVHDLLRFAQFHLKQHLSDQKAILSDEPLDEMQRATAPFGESQGYGIGWIIDEERMGYRSVGHEGGMGGVRTILWMLPEEAIAVAVLANTSRRAPFLPHALAEDMLAVLLPRYAEHRRARRTAQESDPSREEQPPEDAAPPPDLVGTWRGSVHTYQGDVPLTLWFKETGAVHAQLGAQLKTLVNEVEFKDGWLTGRMLGDMSTPDAHRPHHLHLDLKRRGNQLTGAILALTAVDEEGGAPGRRHGDALSHWAEVAQAS
jgi:hypothetical protein